MPTIEDTSRIAQACKRMDAKIVVIDPLMGYIGDANSWKDQEVRQALAPLTKMAEELNVAVLIVRHLNKASSSQSMYRGGGSIGIIGLARVGLLIGKDPDDDNRRVLAGIKSNLGPLPPSLTFSIEYNNDVAFIVWGGLSTHSADALLSIPTSPEERTALDEARDFLRDILAEGAMNAKDVFKKAKEVGIADKTLQRAKKLLAVVSQKLEFKGAWHWMLPPEGGHEMPKVVIQNNDHLGKSLTTLGDEYDHCVASCLLTPGQRELCERAKPCPKQDRRVDEGFCK
jgi:hypothetical protein